MNILLTGGAGYIGSHVVKQLLETTKYNITILDNLSTGTQKTLDILGKIASKELSQTEQSRLSIVIIDLKEFDKISEFLQKQRFDIVIHFAASIVVPESVENPLKYYMNNTINTTNLIKCSQESGVKKFIFSSTAAVYGEPNHNKSTIDESCELNPINPYGMSKLMSERILQDSARANNDFKYIIFRYFNVAGADMNTFGFGGDCTPRIGECHEPETHLIPLVAQTALGIRDKFCIYGDDFDTKDGTCVRDYIHVDDLSDAHIKAIDYLDFNDSDIFNVGYGVGYSVREVIETIKKTTKKIFQVDTVSRRDGDPAYLVADNTNITTKMNWQPKYNDLELICQSAYKWESKLRGENI